MVIFIVSIIPIPTSSLSGVITSCSSFIVLNSCYYSNYHLLCFQSSFIITISLFRVLKSCSITTDRGQSSQSTASSNLSSFVTPSVPPDRLTQCEAPTNTQTFPLHACFLVQLRIIGSQPCQSCYVRAPECVSIASSTGTVISKICT